MNSFYSRFLSHDPLLETDTPVETINPPSQTRQCPIIVIGICFIILLVLFILSLVFIVTNKQQLWTIRTNMNMPTTSTSVASSELKLTSKHQ
jgi:hypothetical protein